MKHILVEWDSSPKRERVNLVYFDRIIPVSFAVLISTLPSESTLPPRNLTLKSSFNIL